VLLAMGADEARARGSLRFSLGHTTTQADVDALGAAIGDAVTRARRAAATTGLLARCSAGPESFWPDVPQAQF
jgi:hypothetical protein